MITAPDYVIATGKPREGNELITGYLMEMRIQHPNTLWEIKHCIVVEDKPIEVIPETVVISAGIGSENAVPYSGWVGSSVRQYLEEEEV